MDIENYEKIGYINFPNTVDESCRTSYSKTQGCWFKRGMEGGEMAGIEWIEVWKEDKQIAYIKMSVCDIFFI